jgi:response regulator RpfG family c-di-GMP phosphodiesterase
VDDEENVLSAFARHLRRGFSFDTALGPHEGLTALAENGPYAVVVSDMRMPEMDGVAFLSEVERLAPDAVRMMLTGNVDVETATQAVNEGHVFRFLTKPCSPEDLSVALLAGIDQYRLVRAERDLLENTLIGAVKVLTDLLSMTNPAAFARASRVKALVHDIVLVLGTPDAWKIELAAMLSQIGLLTLPDETVARYIGGARATARDLEMLQRYPVVGRQLVEHIPRLDEVAEMIGLQQRTFEEDPGLAGTIHVGARILKVALDFDALAGLGTAPVAAIRLMEHRRGWYDPEVFAGLKRYLNQQAETESAVVSIDELHPGMVVAENVWGENGALLVKAGQEVTPALCHRLRNFSVVSSSVKIQQRPGRAA